MSIYDADGNALYAAYDADGNALPKAYDADGNVIWTAEPITLKVMTYNVGGWYIGSGTNVPADKKNFFYAMQTGMIEDNDPDILIIQEYLANFSADGTSALTMLQGLFPYVHTKTSGKYSGRAICSKYPITNYVEHAYSVHGSGVSPYYDSCTITKNGVALTIVDTHLDTDATRRAQHIQELIPFLETLDRFIIGGDFNTMIIPSTANTSSSNYINYVKPFVDAGFNTANFQDVENGFKVTYIDNDWYGYLDDIYTSSNIFVSNVYVDTTKEDEIATIGTRLDHMPLIATVTI